MEKLWRARDEEGMTCDLERLSEDAPGIWHISLFTDEQLKTPNYEYPIIEVNEKDLRLLFVAIGKELNIFNK